MALTALVVLVVPAAASDTVEPAATAAVVSSETSAPAEATESVSDPTSVASEDISSDLSEPPASTMASEEPAESTDLAVEIPAASDEPQSEAAAARVVAAAALAPELFVTLVQETGTGPFDADDAPGHDSSATNNIVRTNDTVAYTVGVRYEGGDQTTPTITFSLPQGQELVQLPPFCLTGSSLSPATLPAPTVPVTNTSWTTLPSQSITCVVADQAQGTSLDYKFLAKVRPEVPNGTALTPVTTQATSAQVTTPAVSPAVSQVVSAQANFDISKRGAAINENSGGFYQYYTSCVFDPARACVNMEFPLTMNAPSGGKGITPLASPITLVDDLTPDSFFGAGTTTSPAWTAAGADAFNRYGARIVSCSNGTQNLHAYIPGPKIYATDPNDLGSDIYNVRDNGTVSCTQAGPGQPVQFTFTDADTTAFTVPTKSNYDRNALPADSGYVLSTAVRIQVPLDAVKELGTAVDNTFTLNWRNQFTDIVATDIAGNPNQGENLANNARAGTTKLESYGGFGKLFAGITGKPGNTSATSFSSGPWEGPPGSGTAKDGNTVVLPGQTVLSTLDSVQGIPPQTGTDFARSRLMCDVWDDTKLAMPQTFDFAGAGHTYIQRPSDGAPAWVSGWIYNGAFQQDVSGIDDLTIQYSYTPTPGPGANSSCQEGDWFDSPAAVPGATVVNGLWQGVNRVRVFFTSRASATSETYEVIFSIAHTVLPTAGPLGTTLPNYASLVEGLGVQTLPQLLASETASELLSSYNQVNNAGAYGDRLILGQAAARIKKFVRNSQAGEFTDTAVPQYTAGANVDYRLNPTLTADVAATGTFTDVTVEDCLPRYQAFVSSVRESGAAISPVIVQTGSPAGADLICAAGETYVKWELGSNEVGQAIDPIVYSVEILETVRNGNYINTTRVAATGDPSPASARTDTAQIQIVVPTGIKISKAVNKPLVEVNPDGVTTPRDFTWTIDFANIDAPQNVSDADVIDVLPVNGVNGSVFTGGLTFNSAAVNAGTGITILYTKAPSASLSLDPGAATNGSAGATTWCTAPTGGTVAIGAGTVTDCPASAAEVTGLRFVRPGAFLPSDVMTVDVTMTPTVNAAGDIYENRAGARVVGVTQPVGPAVRQVAVISSGIGDYVWYDANGNGIQDEGELPVVGFPVSLTGTDLDGNAVSLTTSTAPDGKYLFAGLASGTYTVTFLPSGLLTGQSFTTQGAGDPNDPTVDSDGDPITGVTAPIVLGPNSQDLDIDQGIVQAYTSVLLHKVVVDPTPSVPGRATEFPVTLTCTPAGSDTPIVNEVVLSISGEEITVDDIPVGATCSVNETDANGAAVTIAPASPFVAGDTEPVSITVTNTYQPGLTSVDLRKVVLDPTPAAAGRATEFPVTLSCVRPGGEEAIDIPIVLDIDGTVVNVPGIYLGSTCSVTEDDTNGAQVTIDPEGDFVAGTEGVAVTVTNTYEAVLSSIELHKVIVDPNPADEHGDAETFPVTLTCVAPGSDEPVTVEVELPRDGTVVTLTEIPVGTVCTAEETDTDGGVSSIDPAGEFVVGEEAVAITVINTFPPPPPVTPSPSSSEQPPTSATPTSQVPPTVSVTPTQGTAPVVPAPNPPKGTAGGGLAHTGVSLATWLTVAALLLGLGGAVMLQARRPRKSGLHS